MGYIYSEPPKLCWEPLFVGNPIYYRFGTGYALENFPVPKRVRVLAENFYFTSAGTGQSPRAYSVPSRWPVLLETGLLVQPAVCSTYTYELVFLSVGTGHLAGVDLCRWQLTFYIFRTGHRRLSFLTY